MACETYRDRLLLGASWYSDRADAACTPFANEVRALGMEDYNWCHEHWPLEGVVNGATRRLIDAVRPHKGQVFLLTCTSLRDARHCLGAEWLQVPGRDSWWAADEVFRMCLARCAPGAVFVWAAGGGLKPTAWKVWRQAQYTTHIDIGHLFNGALGMHDYGWLERRDGPWYQPYFRDFAPYVRRFIP
jgi:hypothetical protein